MPEAAHTTPVEEVIALLPIDTPDISTSRRPPPQRHCIHWRRLTLESLGAAVAAAFLFVGALALFPTAAKLVGVGIYRTMVVHSNGAKPTLCMEAGFTDAVTLQLAEACTRLNAAEASYWLDEGTLLSAIREQRVFPHDYDADIAYLRSDHAKVVGALKDLRSGTFFRQNDFDGGGLGRGNAARWKFMIDLTPLAEAPPAPHSALRGLPFAAVAAAIEPRLAFRCGDSQHDCTCRRWTVFPLRRLGGEGRLAHCQIPNVPWLFYEQRRFASASWAAWAKRFTEAALDKRDVDLRACVPRNEEEKEAFRGAAYGEAVVEEGVPFGDGIFAQPWWQEGGGVGERRVAEARLAARRANGA